MSSDIPSRSILQLPIEKIDFQFEKRIPKAVLHNLKFRSTEDLFNRSLIHSVEGFLLSVNGHRETVEETKTCPDEVTTAITDGAGVRLPDTWWDFAKVSLKKTFPTFFSRLRIEYRTISWQTAYTTQITKVLRTTIKEYRVCPHLEIDPEQTHIHFLVTDTAPIYANDEFNEQYRNIVSGKRSGKE